MDVPIAQQCGRVIKIGKCDAKCERYSGHEARGLKHKVRLEVEWEDEA